MDFKKLRNLDGSEVVDKSVDSDVSKSVDKSVDGDGWDLLSAGGDVSSVSGGVDEIVDGDGESIVGGGDSFLDRSLYYRERARAARTNKPVMKDKKNFYKVDSSFGDRFVSSESLVDPDGNVDGFGSGVDDGVVDLSGVVGSVVDVVDDGVVGVSDFVGAGSVGEGEIFYPWVVGGSRGVGGGVGRDSGVELSVFRKFSEDRVVSNVRGRLEFGGGRVREKDLKSGIGEIGALRFVDRDLLVFLVKFRFVSEVAVSNVLGVSVGSARKRLRKLMGFGLVVCVDVWGGNKVWVATRLGVELSGVGVGVQDPNGVKLSLLNHQFVVNHVASFLFNGVAGVDVLGLGEGEFPLFNRVSSSGDRVLGEDLVCESEIHSSFSKTLDVFNKKLDRLALQALLNKYFVDAGVLGGVSPEQVVGNEFLLALYPPSYTNLNWHFPDLVVRRGRLGDGSPGSIAVEVELNTNDVNVDKYVKTLMAYKLDDRIFRKVVWVVQRVEVARKIEAAAKRIDFFGDRLDIVDIVTSDGSLGDRKLWSL